MHFKKNASKGFSTRAVVILMIASVLGLIGLGFISSIEPRQEAGSGLESAKAKEKPKQENSNEVEYRFGIVPQFEPRHHAGIWVPILDELEKLTGSSSR